jgi:hypothetical protein
MARKKVVKKRNAIIWYLNMDGVAKNRSANL